MIETPGNLERVFFVQLMGPRRVNCRDGGHLERVFFVQGQGPRMANGRDGGNLERAFLVETVDIFRGHFWFRARVLGG